MISALGLNIRKISSTIWCKYARSMIKVSTNNAGDRGVLRGSNVNMNKQALKDPVHDLF